MQKIDITFIRWWLGANHFQVNPHVFNKDIGRYYNRRIILILGWVGLFCSIMIGINMVLKNEVSEPTRVLAVLTSLGIFVFTRYAALTFEKAQILTIRSFLKDYALLYKICELHDADHRKGFDQDSPLLKKHYGDDKVGAPFTSMCASYGWKTLQRLAKQIDYLGKLRVGLIGKEQEGLKHINRPGCQEKKLRATLLKYWNTLEKFSLVTGEMAQCYQSVTLGGVSTS